MYGTPSPFFCVSLILSSMSAKILLNRALEDSSMSISAPS